ncbi:twin-arginine translocase subunit TatC [Paraburkholderia youngii]|uniref:Sec-independent protein translocase protein TatC n=1 Tax=Paraburkholderia youngii TaxID=2782701 RepID=A0ABX2NW37_9BURK|nr:twin-arginine translocase subunit TatC [Paraburkholderia youngii]NVI08233.1 twin-arginine translocase subunit TatC [Paraburkholderia youngii]
MSSTRKLPYGADEQAGQADQPYLAHIVELRRRLMRAAASVLGAFVGLVYWAPETFRLVVRPLADNLPQNGKLIITDVTGSFFVPMKVTMMVAFVVALPVVLHELWSFAAPGLYRHERRLIGPLVVCSYVLFLAGMAFSYFLVSPAILHVMAHYNAPLGAQMMTDIDHYLRFTVRLFIAFGVAFEVPVVIVVLVRSALVDIAKLKQIRPYMIVGAFVVAAVVTPPDVVSQLLLAGPLVLLYELGIVAARMFGRIGRSADQ